MKVFAETDIGRRRKMNQDFVYASEQPVGNLPNLFVVADGMGGHNAGDFASRFGVSILVETVMKDTNFNPVKIMRHGLKQPTLWCWNRQERCHDGWHGELPWLPSRL